MKDRGGPTKPLPGEDLRCITWGHTAVANATRLAPRHINRDIKALFSFITQNWRGKPLVSQQVIVRLIGSTTTEEYLKVYR